MELGGTSRGTSATVKEHPYKLYHDDDLLFLKEISVADPFAFHYRGWNSLSTNRQMN